MAFLLDDAFLPATLTARSMGDREFAELCAAHPDLNFEMSAAGELIVMAPAQSLTGIRNARVSARLDMWAEQDGRGFAFDSSAGFVLPNGARRSPDASWALLERVDQAAPTGNETFYHLCPDFVIGLRSPSDRMAAVRNKMREYIANGAALGWLIDPQNRTVEIYRPDRDLETLPGADAVHGEDPVAGFVLDLPYIWNPRGR